MSQHPKPATYYYTLIQNACFILHRTTCLYSEAAIWVGGWFLGYGALPARLVVGALRFTRLGFGISCTYGLVACRPSCVGFDLDCRDVGFD